MFKIVDLKEFKSKYVHRDDCAGINWVYYSEHEPCGNIALIKEREIDGPPFRTFVISQILYFRIIGNIVVLQDKDFVPFYK